MTLYYLHIREGFSWGGSIIDYVLNLSLSDKGWMIIPVGIGFFILYFITFYFYIIKRKVSIIGQIEDNNFDEEKSEEEKDLSLSHNQYQYMSKKILENIGTKENVIEYENCITRLRLELKDTSLINKEKIMQTGAHGAVIIDKHNAQIIIGPEVTENVKIKNTEDFKPKKGDFVKLISSDDGKTYYKKDIVDHDDIPHGLMMKIHEMDMDMDM